MEHDATRRNGWCSSALGGEMWEHAARDPICKVADSDRLKGHNV